MENGTWVFDIKPGYKTTPSRFKASLVAKGFTQEYGVDYEETIAPVLKHSALRIVFGLIASLDLETTLLDVKTAFLYENLDEENICPSQRGFRYPREKWKSASLSRAYMARNRHHAYGTQDSMTS